MTQNKTLEQGTIIINGETITFPKPKNETEKLAQVILAGFAQLDADIRAEQAEKKRKTLS